jgi:adenylate kinase
MSGPPGSGKGTQASLLSARFGIPAISTGELLRAEVRAGTALGRELDEIFARGAYAGDDLVNRIVASRLASPGCASGAILDGYPRTRAQSLYLASLLTRLGWSDPWLIHLDVPADCILARLQDRRQCTLCGLTYNTRSSPPARPGLCDACQRPLTQRADDEPGIVSERVKVYTASDPMDLNCWNPSRRIVVNGTLSPPDVFQSIEQTLMLSG